MTVAIPQRAPAPSAPRVRFWYPYLLIAPAMVVLVVVSLVPVRLCHLSQLPRGQLRSRHRLRRTRQLRVASHERALLERDRGRAIFVLIAVPIEFMLGLAGALVLNQRSAAAPSLCRSCSSPP